MDRYVDFCKGDVIKISGAELKKMELIAQANVKKKRYRICLHDTPENRQHEMFICMTKDDYSRPHKHINMSETHVIIKGSERVVMFDDAGKIIDTFILEDNGEMICYRVNSDVYHMSIPLSDTIIELEVKGGPFLPESNIWAPWAPDGEDILENQKFVSYILGVIDNENKAI